MKSFFFAFLLIISMQASAQSNKGINYQGMAYQNGLPVRNSDIELRLSLLLNPTGSPATYSEIHSLKTDQHGLFHVVIGKGVQQEGTFEIVDWSKRYFLKTELRIENKAYETLGITELLAVPYAHYAFSSQPQKLILGSDSLQIGQGNTVSLRPYRQHLSYKNDSLIISNGNRVFLPVGGQKVATNVCDNSNKGAIRFNALAAVPQMCNGQRWINLNFTIPQNFSSVDLMPIDPSNASSSDGSITATPVGGLAPYTYRWSTGATTNKIQNLPPGRYTVTVKDANLDSLKLEAVLSFVPDANVVDVDGNEYTVVNINGLRWLGQNLNVTKTPSGQSIISYCYNNDPSICETDGRLYTWEVARQVCPVGWRLATKPDFEKLIADLTPDVMEKLLPGGSSGLNFIYAGMKTPDYVSRNTNGYLWASTEYDNQAAHMLGLLGDYSPPVYFLGRQQKESAASVRCVK